MGNFLKKTFPWFIKTFHFIFNVQREGGKELYFRWDAGGARPVNSNHARCTSLRYRPQTHVKPVADRRLAADRSSLEVKFEYFFSLKLPANWHKFE